jgi:hypothetical protein
MLRLSLKQYHKMENYYAYFDAQTENGRVQSEDLSAYEADLPRNDLLPMEVEARTSWNATKTDELAKYYLLRHPLNEPPGKVPAEVPNHENVDTQEKLLQERVTPPLFTTKKASTRNMAENRHPKNPAMIYEWADFRNGVQGFIPPENLALEGVPAAFSVFEQSLLAEAVVRKESQEEVYHHNYVLAKLRRAHLLHYTDDQDVESKGLPDYILSERDSNTVKVCIEYKATHNLPLPMSTRDILQRYNSGQAVNTGEQTVEQKRDKQRVCDPLGQLFRYMGMNGARYGALTSATRTYFCFFDDDLEAVAANQKVAGKVYVSDAWFIGQQNYLRAWAYVWSLAQMREGYNPAEVGWLDSEEENQQDDSDTGCDDNDGSSEGGNGSGTVQSKKRRRLTEHRSNIPFSSYSSIKFLDALGYGRNGCVFRARWEGKEVAVKQFDIGRRGVAEMFQREILAYDLLREAQGYLIPKAFFLSESCGVKYLGLQLGRLPKEGDDTSSWPKILQMLESKYGFCHMDSDRRNGLFIADSTGNDRLVAIDLEEYHLTKKGKNLLKASGLFAKRSS